jgi:hypothetical protein
MHKNKINYNIFTILPILGWVLLHFYFAVSMGKSAISIMLFAWIPYVIPHLLYGKRINDSHNPILWKLSSALLVLSAIATWFLTEHGGWLIIYGPLYYLAAGIVIWCIAILIDAAINIRVKIKNS